MATAFVKAFNSILLVAAGILVYADHRVAIELALSGSLLLLALHTAGRLSKRGFLSRLSVDPELIFFALFAYVSTVQALTHVVDTDIPRYRAMLRGVYYLYLIALSTPYARKLPRHLFGLLSIVIFTSFPFHWMFVFGHLRSVPVFLAALQVWLLYASGKRGKGILPLPILTILTVMAISLLVSILYHGAFPVGMDFMLRFAAGALLFFVISGERERGEVVLPIFGILVIGYLVHQLFFYSGVFSTIISRENFNPIFDKISFIAGVNANDISGYLLTALPILLACADRSDRRWLRAAYLGFFLLNLMLLWIVKSRFAWPVAAAEIAFYYMLKRRGKPLTVLERRSLIFLAVATIAASIVVFTLYANRIERLMSLGTLWNRYDLWRLSVDILGEYPILGAGPENHSLLATREIANLNLDSYRDEAGHLPPGGAYLHSHNLFLQMWLNGGLLFLGGFLLLSGMALRDFFMGDRRIESVAFASVLIAILLEGLMNYHFMDYPVWIAWIISIAMLIRGWGAPAIVPSRFAGPIAVSLFAVIIYHTVAIYHHSEAIRLLRPYRYSNAFGDLVLREGDLPADRIYLAEHLDALSRSLRLSLILYPRSVTLNSDSGEFEYFVHRVSGGDDMLLRSETHFKRCLELSPDDPFCSKRLYEIGLIRRPDGTDHLKYLRHSERHDPFQRLKERESPF